MDETIGARGSHNDRKRSLRISKEKKKKLKELKEEKEIKELEKDVKKKQIYTLIKVLPIAAIGGTIKTLTSKNKKEENKKEEELIVVKNKKEKTKEVVVIDENGNETVIRVPITSPIKEEKKIIKKEDIVLKEHSEKELNTGIDKQKEEKEVVKKTKEKEIDIENIELPRKRIYGISEFDDLTLNEKEKLNKLKNKKLIDEYEKYLKDIRYDLRSLIFDYNVLVDEEDKAINSEELGKILDRLNEVIEKVEILKNKIQIENFDKYDDNYLYTLIEDYLLEFKDKKVVKEIEDSPLYVLLSKKIDELDQKKDELKVQVEDRKQEQELKEEDFYKMKEKYYRIEKINKDLLSFQYEQDMLLKEVKYKVKNATSISEKVKVETEAMNIQSRRLLRMLTLSMLFPVPRAAVGATAMTAAYLRFMRQMLNPKTKTTKYRVITVKDYSSDIEYSINFLSDNIRLLKKTDKEIDKMIKDVKDEFSEYLGVYPEFDELLSNLERVKRDLREKEEELERIKKEEEKQLELNDQKVLTRGEYPM